ncbi:hypothetical protein F7R23_16195 [Burkholderia diffusa]|nr:hypothetical protein F7R23_16195 [Burkholderia diffusa]
MLRRPDDTREDKELTAFLNAQVATILSASHEPRPRCPRCGSSHITSAGFRTRPSGRTRTCRGLRPPSSTPWPWLPVNGPAAEADRFQRGASCWRARYWWTA